MNKNSVAIITLCSSLCKNNTRPLSNEEWSQMATALMEKKIPPCALLEYSKEDFLEKLSINEEYAERLYSLIGRTGSLYFELSKYEKMGIYVVTRADEAYPREIKRELGNACPPIFYYVGDISIFDNEHQYIDNNEQISENSSVPYVKAVSGIMKSIKQSSVIKAVQKGRLLIISENI